MLIHGLRDYLHTAVPSHFCNSGFVCLMENPNLDLERSELITFFLPFILQSILNAIGLSENSFAFLSIFSFNPP